MQDNDLRGALLTSAVSGAISAVVAAAVNLALPAASQLDLPSCAAFAALGAIAGFLAGSVRAKKRNAAEAEARIVELRKKHESQLDAERESREREISELRAESNEKLEAEQERHEAEVASLNESHAAQTAAMQADFESRLEAMRAEHSTEAENRARKKAEAEKLDWLSRVFATLSPSRKSLVAEALDNGEVVVPEATEALVLAKLGLLVPPAAACPSKNVSCYLNPEFATEIREHREWLA